MTHATRLVPLPTSSRVACLLALVLGLAISPPEAAVAASKSHSVNNNTAITQTHYLYYNTSTCEGGTSAQMYKTTVKWSRSDTSFSADHQGGKWGYNANECGGPNNFVSRSLADVGGISYGTTYTYNYTFKYVTNIGAPLVNVGSWHKAKVYRGSTYKTTLCTKPRIWSDGSPCG